MSDYIVYYWGHGGVIERADPHYEPVAFLHCELEEARKIADDLNAVLLLTEPPDLAWDDCPVDCEHAANWDRFEDDE